MFIYPHIYRNSIWRRLRMASEAGTKDVHLIDPKRGTPACGATAKDPIERLDKDEFDVLCTDCILAVSHKGFMLKEQG